MSAIYPCYAVCNNVVLFAQQAGKSASMCSVGSVFESLYAGCQSCLSAHGSDSHSFISEYINRFYADTVDFCTAEPAGVIGVSGADNVTSISSCPPYPTAKTSFSSMTSYPVVPASTLTVTTELVRRDSNSSLSTSYAFGFWLEYTFTPCPTRTTNPSFSYPTGCLEANQSLTKLTWGCPPGSICRPPQVGCDLEVGPPNSSYLCSPEECLPLPTFTSYPITTVITLSSSQSTQTPSSLPGSSSSSSSTIISISISTTTDTTTATVTTQAPTIYSPLPLNPGYYNLDPVIFGADWGLFTGEVSVTSFSSAETSVPTTTSNSTGAGKIQTPASASHAWIAGPVVGSLAGIAFIVWMILFFIKRNRPPKAKTPDVEITHDKPQLDGEEVKPKEVAGQEIGELESRHVEPNPVEPVEMDTGYTGVELNAAAKANIRRKPVPRK